MRLNAPSLAIGIAIGAVALSMPLIYMATQSGAESDTGQPQAAFFLSGYLYDISEDEMVLNQIVNAEGFHVEELEDASFQIQIESYTHVQCARWSTVDRSDCAELFSSGVIPIDTTVCALVHLTDNRLYGSKIFIGAPCEIQPKA